MKTCEHCSITFVPKYPWNKNRFCSTSCRGKGIRKLSGNDNPSWKGSDVSYSGIHKWINYNRKKSGTCEMCLTDRRTTWSNISGGYLRDYSDWQELCYSCHRIYDAGILSKGAI